MADGSEATGPFIGGDDLTRLPTLTEEASQSFVVMVGYGYVAELMIPK